MRDRSMGFIVMVIAFGASLAAHGSDYKPPTSEPKNLYGFNDHMYFEANDGIHGPELWRANPKTRTVEFVADVTKGPGGAALDRFFGFGETLWFRRMDENSNGELWRTDGVPGGTTELIWREEGEMENGGVQNILCDLNGHLVFTTGLKDSSGVYRVTDGTPSGTRPLFLFDGFPLQSRRAGAAIRDDLLYFSARDSLRGPGLWCSNGSPESARFILRFKTEPEGMLSLGEAGVIFNAETEELGRELWISRGTPETTHLLKDIYEGAEFSSPEFMCLKPTATPAEPQIAYFAATHPEFGRELWQSDGTSEGTKLVQDLVPGAIGSEPFSIRPYFNAFYMAAYTPEFGTEVWASDHGGPFIQVGEGMVGPESSAPYSLCVGDGGFLYYSQKSAAGEEFWCTAAVPNSARMLLDIHPTGNSEPYWPASVNERVFFSAEDPVRGRELWMATGPKSPPELFADINTDNSTNPSSFPSEMQALGDKLLFAADDVEHGNELWVTDGTEAGTVLLRDIASGIASSNPTQITTVGDHAYFCAETPGQGFELWVTDGSTKGTVIAADIFPSVESSSPNQLKELNGKLLFSAFRPYEGNELWIAEPGKAPGILKNIREGGESSDPQDFTIFKGHAYFRADDGLHGEELWRTDGTEEGTILVRDVVQQPFEAVAASALRAAGDRLYVSAFSRTSGWELWVLQQDMGPPRLVRDIAPPARIDVRAKTP